MATKNVADVALAQDGARNRLVISVEELATSGWLKEDVETVLKYKEVVKQALRNVTKKVRGCVLRYEYVLDEIYALTRDDEEAWRVDISLYSILIFTHVKIDDVVVYKIYADGNDGTNDVLVVLFGGGQLTERQIEVLKEVASLFTTKFYDKFDDRDGRFYDATSISRRRRSEVYIVLHNLVCTWTNCCNVARGLEEKGE